MKNFRHAGALLCAIVFLTAAWPALAQIPSLKMEQAIELAKAKVDEHKDIDVKQYYIYSVVLSVSPKGQNWYHTFRSVVPSQYNEIFAKVYMDGAVELTGGPFSSGKRY